MTGSAREPEEILWKRGPYDLTEIARIRGPGHRGMALANVAIVFVGMLTFAVVRTIQLGGPDGWAIFWFVVAGLWGLGFASMELGASRGLEQDAHSHSDPDAETILFRTGQLTRGDGDWTSVPRGWVTISDDRFTITSSKRRKMETGHLSAALATAHAISVPGSYGILRLAFTDGSVFESFPVGAGIHNLGLSPARVRALAATLQQEHGTAAPE
jgi:hypothetical protein